MHKAFVAVPVSPKPLHDIYVEGIRHNLELAKKSLAKGTGNRVQLENRLKLWTLMRAEEAEKDR